MRKRLIWVAGPLLFSANLLSAYLFSGSAMAAEWVVDVRTPEEVAAGKVEGAVNIEYQDILAGAQKLGLKKDDTIHLYCRSGRRSGLAQEALQSAGFTHVDNLGGYEQAQAWKSAKSSETVSTSACQDAAKTGQNATSGC